MTWFRWRSADGRRTNHLFGLVLILASLLGLLPGFANGAEAGLRFGHQVYDYDVNLRGAVVAATVEIRANEPRVFVDGSASVPAPSNALGNSSGLGPRAFRPSQFGCLPQPWCRNNNSQTVLSRVRVTDALHSVPNLSSASTTPPEFVATKTPGVAADLAESGTIDLSRVRFLQDSVKSTFTDGGAIDDLTAGLRDGSIKPGSVDPIRIFERDGKLWTLDHRRLYAFQNARVNIPYRMATPAEIAAEAFKLSTKNGGVSVRVRGGG